MVSRYLIQSGIPMSQTTICKEIQNMTSTLVEDLDFSDLKKFEFITRKTGRRGPTKEECIKYYNQKFVLSKIK